MSKIFLTEYKRDGKRYGDRIYSNSWNDAELKCRDGEYVIGELVYECEVTIPEIFEA